MRILTLTACCLAMLAAVTATPAPANPHASRLTFRDIEFETPRDQREATGEAMVARAVPIGSSIMTARDVLRDRGAHCRTLSADGVLRCSFGAFDTIENHLQDVAWDIRVASKGGTVEAVEVHRISRGS